MESVVIVGWVSMVHCAVAIVTWEPCAHVWIVPLPGWPDLHGGGWLIMYRGCAACPVAKTEAIRCGCDDKAPSPQGPHEPHS